MMLTGAVVSKLKFNDGTTKKCVVIPIEAAGLFTGEKGVFLNVFARRLREERYGQSHCLRVTYPKEAYNAMLPEQRNALPIVGNMRPAGMQHQNRGTQPTPAPVNLQAAKAEPLNGYAAEINDIF